MSTITGKDGTTIFYKCWGQGPVVTFSHGWRLTATHPDLVNRDLLAFCQQDKRQVA